MNVGDRVFCYRVDSQGRQNPFPEKIDGAIGVITSIIPANKHAKARYEVTFENPEKVGQKTYDGYRRGDLRQ